MQVDSVTITISGSEDQFDEERLAAAIIMVAKLDFLTANRKNITLEQLPYMLGTLPDSIYWEENLCGQCESMVKFTKPAIKEWSFDEVKAHWVCPLCRIADLNAIAKTAKDAGAKAEVIEAKAAEKGGDEPEGDVCEECNTPLVDGKCPTESCPMFGMELGEDGDDEDGEDETENEREE